MQKEERTGGQLSLRKLPHTKNFLDLFFPLLCLSFQSNPFITFFPFHNQLHLFSSSFFFSGQKGGFRIIPAARQKYLTHASNCFFISFIQDTQVFSCNPKMSTVLANWKI